MKILLKNAKILTLKNEKIFSGEILVHNHKIAQIARKIKVKADQVIDCEGNLLMPGFKNPHTHSAMTFLRSLADDMDLATWLHQFIFPMESCFKKDDVYHLTKLAVLEYLTSGITAAGELYYFPQECRRAFDDMNFRASIICMPNFFKQSFKETNSLLKQKDTLTKYNLGFHAEYTSVEKDLKEISKLAHKYKIPVYGHMSETKSEVEGCLKRHKLTPPQYIAKLGIFDYGGGIYHGVYLNNKDMQILKKKNVYVCSCPASNLKLASGIAPIKDMQKVGLKIAIGTDGPASNNGLDMFREMYLLSTLSKYKEENPASLKAFDVLKMATVNGAHMMGMFDADVLSANKCADIIMIDLYQPDMQPINNIVSNLVYSGNKLDVKMTMINGKILYYNHKFYLKDSPETIYKKASEITHRLIKDGQNKLKK